MQIFWWIDYYKHAVCGWTPVLNYKATVTFLKKYPLTERIPIIDDFIDVTFKSKTDFRMQVKTLM